MAILLVSSMCVVTQTHADRLCLTGSFDHQVATVLSHIRLSDERLGNISQVPRDLERLFQHHWPGCKVLRFGSTITMLALKSSDVDCFVDIPGDDKGDPQALVTEALDILKNHPHLFEHFVLKQSVRVPLLICKHIPANISVDISVSGPFAVNSSRVLSHLLHLDQRGLDLARILKYWGTVHDLANGKLTLPSYAVVLMAVFYLQQKNIVPSVAALQQNATPYEVEHWNTAFLPIEYHTDNNETLYELLGGFFTYYSDFDFRNTVISPYVGYPIKIADFDKVTNFGMYKRNVANGYAKPFPFGYLNIQDNLRHSENVARPSDVQRSALRLIRHVRAAARIYKELSSEEFLTAMLVPEKREETGRKTIFWGGGVIGSLEDCMRHQEKNS
ncbi:speckle targeted PIP5K1A-regulated poly(A) polymerase-like isoform X1 [Manduca sexta]|uniref:speckle targeted PIP5K1A-regulated poly(A) polymerase-like isoform X1 n=2 Tax=Manduca sexta TaxID=7130 RepID=UPI00188EE6D9|nr:speckle targeted PIP5K1A-regulated poly(A) polymerase-like isoform X1 [Manduca sexta]